jgi:cytidylate kinase
VAAIPQVRAALVEYQRRFARRDGGAVLDGRDIGTVICPEAEVKLYVTASDAVRARRRWQELGGPDAPLTEAAMLDDLRARDARDAGRLTAPLAMAPDAVLIDTSGLSIAQAVAQAVAEVERRLAEN